MRASTIEDIEQINKMLLKMPVEKVKEVEDFVEFVYTKTSPKEGKKIGKREELNLEGDPLLKLIGTVNTEPFADKIDHELYGK